MRGRRHKKPPEHNIKPVGSYCIRASEWRWRMDAICRCTMDELQQVIRDPETDAADLMICQIVVHAIKTGDQKRLDFILERTVGKVKESLEIQTPTPVVIKRKNGEEIELGTVLKGEDDEREFEEDADSVR